MKRSNQLITAYILAVFALAGLLPGVANQQAEALYSKKRIARECREATIATHRGELGRYAGSHHDENTIHAFKGAVDRGARVIETDLRLTKDGAWVLMHDATVKRTTNGKGKVSDKTLAQIKKLRTDHGYRVPTLERTLKFFAPQSKVKFQLEIKQNKPTDAELRHLVSLIHKHGLANRVMLTSFKGEVLVRVKAIDASIPTGYIAATGTRPSVATAQTYQVDQVMIHHKDLTERYLDTMSQNGITVGTRSATSGSHYSTIIAKGSTYLVLDGVRSYKNWCNGL